MKKVTTHACWNKQAHRPGQIKIVGDAVDEALKEAFKELGLNIDVNCRGDLDSFGLHFSFVEKEKKPEPAPVAKPNPVENPATKEGFVKKTVKWKKSK